MLLLPGIFSRTAQEILLKKKKWCQFDPFFCTIGKSCDNDEIIFCLCAAGPRQDFLPFMASCVIAFK